MIRLANLLQAPTVSIYQLVKTKTFALHLFDMVKWIKWKWNEICAGEVSVVIVIDK